MKQSKLSNINLGSSLNKLGPTVSQIIHFVGGEKRTFTNVLTDSIKQGQFTKFQCKDGAVIMINDNNVLCIEVFQENKDVK
tara:strand:- start:406 stop:648 length:243 start_codon:yes stop_codon:yes gene_type:complete